MSRFIKELDNLFKDIFKSTTSKKGAKPSLYLYETDSFYITQKLHMLKKNSEHNVFTCSDKLNYLDSVYARCGLSLETNLIREARRTELYKIPDKLFKKHFDCNSVEEFYRRICFLDFENNDLDEEFVFSGDFVLVYSDGNFYIGTNPTQLRQLSEELENALEQPEDTKPIFELEFEDDDD